MILVKEIEK